MKNSTLNGVVLVGELRTRLMYRSRDAMAANWQQVFPEELLPDDHIEVPTEKVANFLKSLSKPQRGRSAAITNAAFGMLGEINAPAVEALPEQIPVAAIEPIQVEPATEVAEKEAPKNAFVEEMKAVTALDVVFYVNMLIADYGLVFLFKEMGMAAGIVYTLVSFHALRMAKDRYSQVTAERGVNAVWALELMAFAIHLSMFNIRAWQAGKDNKLPFSVWDNPQYPFWVAVTLALLFSGSAIYAVSTILALTKERVEAENYEQKHGIKY